MLMKAIRSRSSIGSPRFLLVRLMGYVAITAAVFVIVFKYVEAVSWTEAVWQVWQTFTTVGYGNRPAESTGGIWLTIIIGTIGISFLGAVISQIFVARDHTRERRKHGMENNPFTNGIVWFNCPPLSSALLFIREFRSVDPDVGFCVVDNQLSELPPLLVAAGRVHFVRGSITDRSTYKRARVGENRAAIIFPEDPRSSGSDAATKTIVDLIHREVGGSVRLLHVLVDPNNQWMFEGGPSQPIYQNLSILAAVQEVQDPNTANVVQTMLHNTLGANPQTFTPRGAVGLSWGEFLEKAVAASRRNNILVNPLALIQNGASRICPELDTVIGEDDLISMVAFSDFDYPAFEKAMDEIG